MQKEITVEEGNRREMSLGELVDNWDDVMRLPGMGCHKHPAGDMAKGFTIGNGKLLYWWVSPMPISNTYRCIQAGYEFKKVSIRYGISSFQKITVHY